MRISDWSSDLCSADLAMQQLGAIRASRGTPCNLLARGRTPLPGRSENRLTGGEKRMSVPSHMLGGLSLLALAAAAAPAQAQDAPSGSYDGNEIIVTATKRDARSEEHTSELQSLMRISYAVFCLKKKITTYNTQNTTQTTTDTTHT